MCHTVVPIKFEMASKNKKQKNQNILTPQWYQKYNAKRPDPDP